MKTFQNSLIVGLTCLLWFNYFFGGWLLYEAYHPSHVYNCIFIESALGYKYPIEFVSGLLMCFIIFAVMLFTFLAIFIQLNLLDKLKHD